jgi:hypothetical protein
MGIIPLQPIDLRAPGRSTDQRYADLADQLMNMGSLTRSKQLTDAATEVAELRELARKDKDDD